MKIGIIDIGTNSVLLLVAEKKPTGDFDILDDQATITRLGQDIDSNRFFVSPAMDRTFVALKNYKEICHKNEVEKIVAVGTAAFRLAANAEIFLNRIQNELGLHIEVLSGPKEAEYSFLAASHSFKKAMPELNPIVIDIGGGSTEIIFNQKVKSKADKPFWAKSLPLGSVRLTEQFIHNDPATQKEIEALRKAIREVLSTELSDQKFPVRKKAMVSVAGTATTLAMIQQQLAVYDAKKIHHSVLEKTDLIRIIEKLASLRIKERQQMIGMEPLRADVLLAGACLLFELMEFLEFDQTYVSNTGLRFGLLERIEEFL